MRSVRLFFKTMAVDGLPITEQWIREKLNLQHRCLADVRSLTLPGTYEGKICHLGTSLKNFVRLKSLDLSYNALVTVQGIEHLELLERLNLYYNRLASLQDIFSLHKLQNLKQLDLRLNPVVKKHPHYRLYLVHAIPKLRRLDDCPVRDRERKAALMHFSSEENLDSDHKKQVFIQDTTASSDLRIKAMQKMVKMLSLLEGNEEVALNDSSRKSGKRRNLQTLSVRCENECSPLLAHENPSESDIVYLFNDSDCRRSSKHKQESAPSKSSDYKNDARAGPHRVRFVSPVILRHSSVRGESVFTAHPDSHKQPHSHENDSSSPKWQNQLLDRANLVLHPPRLTYSTAETKDRSTKTLKGTYRKPMELLLSMMEDLWSEKKENQQNRTFLMKMVQILSMMEQEVSGGEQEIQTLKAALKASIAQADVQEKQHQSEIEELTLQQQQAHESIKRLNEQTKSLLEENVSLQKQLIRAEHKLLASRLKNIPHTQDRGVQSVPEEFNTKRDIIADDEDGGVGEQQQSYRSLIARNERLLQQLEEALMSK
nr:centrosomal protein of 72 kDa isoform X1 [Danio rerio]|eukprot:XP_009290997.3 centrosomal protein of 72 kDa isoform X1 [Danio rerio]